MKYYQEITLIEGDKRLYDVWSDVYTQIHIALADIKNKHDIESVGVSFPNYRYEEKENKAFAMLGNKLRVFAPNKEYLAELNLNKWLDRLTDYVHIKSIKEVGNQAKEHVVVRRYRFKNVEKQAEQYAKHKGISYEDALAWCLQYKQSSKPYPFINLKSETNKQNYKLSIIQETVDSPTEGNFNQYGINNASGNTTVPNW